MSAPRAPTDAAETVHVRVVTAEAMAGTATSEAALYAYGLPFVERVEPTSGGVQQGTTVKLFGRNFAGVLGVNFTLASEVLTSPSVQAVKTCASEPCQEEL